MSYVDCFDNTAWQAAIQPKCSKYYTVKALLTHWQQQDLVFLSTLAHDHNVLLIVDNCFATPAIQKTLQLGADVVLHSASKYIDGQGRVLAALVGSDADGKSLGVVRTGGISLSPF